MQKDYSNVDATTKKFAFRDLWAAISRLERGSTKFNFGNIATNFVKLIKGLASFPIVADHPKWNNINAPSDFAWKEGDDEKEWRNVTAFGNIKNGKKGKLAYLNEIERRLTPGDSNWKQVCNLMYGHVNTLTSQLNASHGLMESFGDKDNDTGSTIVNRTAAAAHLFLDVEATVLYARAEYWNGDMLCRSLATTRIDRNGSSAKDYYS